MSSRNLPAEAMELVRSGQVQMVREARVYAVNDQLVIMSAQGARCDCSERGICTEIMAVLLVEQTEQARTAVHHIDLDAGNSDPTNLRLVDPAENP